MTKELEEELAFHISKLWLEIKPSTEAQSIRAKLSVSFDSTKAKDGWLGDLVMPDYVWELIDIAAQMGINAMKEESAFIRALNMVVSDPEILRGTLVIKGTRVPIYDVAASINKGISVEKILEGYPSITAEHVELARFYARALKERRKV